MGPSSNVDAECSTRGCGHDANPIDDAETGNDAEAGIDAETTIVDANGGSGGGPDGSAVVDCSGVTIAGAIRQTVAQVRTNVYLDNVDVTRYAGIWEAHNAQTGQTRSTKWGSPAGFALGVYRAQYIAMAFDTTTADQAQRGQFFRELDAARPSAYAYWSISRCPGDFPLTADACHSGGGAVASLGWEIGTSTPGFCHLEPNTTYYLNILFGTSGNPAVPSCPQDECGHVYQQTVN